MQLTLHAFDSPITLRFASRLVQPTSAWSVKTLGAPSRQYRDARVYSHKAEAMCEMSTPPSPGAFTVFNPPRNLKVHVIEVSDLKGKDSSGTSDPIVYATCLGSTKHTRLRKGVNSAVFDEVLYFNPRNLSR